MAKLYVGNLPDCAKEKDLRELFESFGTVEEVAVMRGYAFIHFIKEEDASAALTSLDDTEFNGAHIQVQMARTKGHGYGRGSGPPRPPPRRGSPGSQRDSYRDSYRDRYYEGSSRDYGRYRGDDYYYDNDYRYSEYRARSRSPPRDYYGRERSRYYERDGYRDGAYRDNYYDSYTSRDSSSRRW